MKMTFLRYLALCVFVAANAQAQTLIISEFMANNGSTLRDEDQSFEDWIEIFNASAQPVNLGGWYLTDSAGDLTKWQFPATNLAAGGYMYVFASTKDKRVAGTNLHTNFRLSGDGEFLALVAPDGTNIVSSFSPEYPAQYVNVSFGYGVQYTNTALTGTGTPVRVLIPSNGDLALDWTQKDYEPTGWISGTNGVGYDINDPALSENSFPLVISDMSPEAYWRLDETTGTTALNTGTLGASANGTYTGGATLAQEGPRPPQFGGMPSTNNAPAFNGTSSYVQTSSSLLNNRPSFTLAGWFYATSKPLPRTGLFGQNDAVEFGFVNTNSLQVWTPGAGGSLSVTYTPPLNEWHHVAAVGDGNSLRLYIDGAQVGAGGGTTASYGSSAFPFRIGGGGIFDTSTNFFPGRLDEVAVWYRPLSATEIRNLYQTSTNANVSYAPWIATDIRTNIYGINSSAYIRIPFFIEDLTKVDRLKLRMRYDDGFTAYLNGHLVASVNAPVTNLWNSTATQRHSDNQAIEFEEFDVTSGAGGLFAGSNILAIQAYNIHSTNVDLLIFAELVASELKAVTLQSRYFTVPTPGQENGFGTADLGPIIHEVTSIPALPQQPTDNEPITVRARVEPSFNALGTVTLHWRVMYGITNTTQMFDDGAHGDGPADDGIFGAVIPANASTNGQMVRWFVRAIDDLGNSSRWPLFDNPLDSAEYLGTVISNPTIQSLLPVVHTFIQDTNAADQRTGTRCSIFYLGEFYDNVFINLHGQSSAGFPKKSYDLDFTQDHRFRYQPGDRRVKDIKILQNHGDKSKLRQSLAWEYIEKAGSAGHFSLRIRVQRNSQFHYIADFVEDPDDLWLERLGWDPNGALYKIYNNLGSTNTNEKKTRRQEGYGDLNILVTNIAETRTLASRATYAYDNIDIPQAISYFTVCALISHQDHGHKNYYVYRDSDKTGHWFLLPWDIDLSWGRNWVDSPGYFTDTMYTNNTLTFYNSAQQNKGANPFYNLFFNHPDFRRMYLRRLRTVMDTILQPPGTPADQLQIEARINEELDKIDPPGVTPSDAFMDWDRWPKWGNNNAPRPEAARIGALYLAGRRLFLYNDTNAALNGERVFSAQPENAYVQVSQVEFNPASSNQAQEFIQITNPTPYYLDLSGWKISGAVDFTFRPGTVISSNNVIYLSPDVNAFRARTSGPRGGQGLYVLGAYNGQLSARGETIIIQDAFGRIVRSNSYPAAPSAAQESLRITEIMYHPAPLAGSTNDQEAFEYIELRNIGSNTLSLAGVKFVNGIDFAFAGSAVTSLAAGESVLVVKSIAAFTERYGSGFNIAGEYLGQLDNGGERLQLLDATNEEILDFSYNNTWHDITDGLGFSLVVVDQNADPDDWGKKSQWRASGQLQGTPGAGEGVAPSFAQVLITEVLSRSDTPPPSDSIELYNAGNTVADISDWYLTDDFNNPHKFRIPPGTSIQPGEFLLFDEEDFNPNPGFFPSFALSSDGDEVYLFSADTNGNLTGYVVGFDFGPADDGISFGRHVISTGADHFVRQVTRTLGNTNAGPLVGPVVISEIMYRPEDKGGSDNSIDEFIEIHNTAGTNVPLYVAHLTAGWRISGGVEFDFPESAALGPNEYALLVNFNPTNTPLLNAFRTRYGVGAGVQCFGPYNGKLDNSADTVELRKPTDFVFTALPYVLYDKVAYEDASPWPPGADGFGLSLQRRDVNAYGNDPANWTAAPPSAGNAGTSGGAAPVITDQPDNSSVIAGQSATLNVAASGTGPFTYRWRFRGNLLAGQTNSSLTFSQTHPSQEGAYDVLVANAYGSTLSSNAYLSVIIPLRFTAHPQSASVFVGPTSNVTFTASVFSTEPTVTWQWRKNGIDISGATGSSYTVMDIEVADEGDYTVVANDGIAPVESNPARLTPKAALRLIQNPESLLVPVGASASLSVTVGGYPFPMGYRWRRNASTVFHELVNSSNHVLHFPSIALTNAGRYDVAITNAATPSGIISTNNRFITVVLPPTNRVAAVGADATFTTIVSNAPSFVVRYQWQKGASQIIDATNSTLTISNIQSSDFGLYSVVVTTPTNGMSASFATRLIQEGAPVITTQPQSQTVAAGANVTFNVIATGDAPLSYQWRFNGNDLPGETAASLQLSSVDTGDVGTYTVRVSNPIGEEVSTPATLSIAAPPALSQPLLVAPGEFRMLLSGTLNKTYSIEVSPDLGAWTELKQVLATNNPTPVLDLTATNKAGFYRARELP